MLRLIDQKIQEEEREILSGLVFDCVGPKDTVTFTSGKLNSITSLFDGARAF